MATHKVDGFISIFTAIILLTIISLLMLGFTYTTRSSVRRTLDDQLHTQAYYSAESGINEALARYRDNPNDPSLNPTNCLSEDVDSSLNVGYTCVLVDTEPSKQVIGKVPIAGTGQPSLLNFEFNPGDIPDTINVSFDESVEQSGIGVRSSGYSAKNPEYPDNASWGDNIGVLRLDIIPFNIMKRQDMVDNMYTVFLYPSTDGSATSTATIQSGQDKTGETILVDCTNTPLRCSIDLLLQGSGSGRNHYRARLQSLYRELRVEVEAKQAGTNLDFINGQMVVDSTGRANDVFRRIQAYIPLTGSGGGYSPPDPGQVVIGSTNAVCKRYFVYPGGIELKGPSGGSYSSSSGPCGWL